MEDGGSYSSVTADVVVGTILSQRLTHSHHCWRPDVEKYPDKFRESNEKVENSLEFIQWINIPLLRW